MVGGGVGGERERRECVWNWTVVLDEVECVLSILLDLLAQPESERLTRNSCVHVELSVHLRADVLSDLNEVQVRECILDRA